LDKTSFTCTNLGANTVTLTVTDASGNASTCTATVTVVDNTAPTAVCQNISVNLDGSGNATITPAMINNGSSDNCTAAGALTLALDKTSFTCADAGANTVTLTVTDASGNASTCTATVTIIDNTAPTAVCQNISVNLDGSGNATITPAMINNGSTDNCTAAGALTLALDKTSFTCADAGANTVTLTVTDASGNASTCTATVTIIDNTAPTAVCQNISVNLDGSGNATITPAMINNGSTDNCTAAGSLVLALDKTSFTTADIGANTVTLTVTDASGNSSTCTATVTIVDNNPPTAICQNITVNLDAFGNASITPAMIDNGSFDDATPVASLIFALDKTSFTCSDLGANTVTLTVTDGGGNSASCTATVSVVNDIAPSSASVDRNNICASDGNITLSYSGGTLGAGSNAVWYNDGTYTTSIGTGNNLTIPTPSTTTTYFVRFEGVCGNSSGVSITENINPLPTPVISGPVEVCSPISETYSTASLAGHSYSWTAAGGIISAGSSSDIVTVDFATSGAATLQLTETIDATGCQLTTPLYNITVFDTPVLMDINSDKKLTRR
ncbi:MAG: hypothetical protein H6538_04220, partial [Bacteroidales bacterium]|nr:hypothetical protein [Bacteroidales bacterium]